MDAGFRIGILVVLVGLIALALWAGGVFAPSEHAADYDTATAGCVRGCCADPRSGGTDCVDSGIPCRDRTDGRNCFKRFIGGVEGCPNTARAGGIVAPPEDYRQFEECWAHN